MKIWCLFIAVDLQGTYGSNHLKSKYMTTVSHSIHDVIVHNSSRCPPCATNTEIIVTAFFFT